MNKNDRRFRKTQKSINDAFAYLLSIKEINKITVKEICEIADINRASFYNHYEDVYDLYQKLEEQIFQHLLVIQNNENKDSDFFEELIDIIVEKKAICKMIFSDNIIETKDDLMNKMIRHFTSECIQSFKDKYHNYLSDCEIIYYSHYHVQGVFAIIKQWVHNDYDLSAEELKRLIKKWIRLLDNN